MVEKREPTQEELESQKNIETSKSKTLPVLIYWLVILPILIALEYTARKSGVDLSVIIYIAGGATFAYMGIEYGENFIKSKGKPTGIGGIPNINRYKTLVYVWLLYMALSLIAVYILGVHDIPYMEVVYIAGALSIEYIVGNKSNKISQAL